MSEVINGARCQICGQTKPLEELIPAELVRPVVADRISEEHLEWSSEGFICSDDLNHYRGRYAEHVIGLEHGELSELEQEVVRSLSEQELVSRDVDSAFEREATFGERLADRVAEFGGSWTFILTFFAVLAGWVALNGGTLLREVFDPYPYILLNLVLSCIAALQAPVIMMSQNRLEERDRLRSQHDYSVNLKAELEIRHINAKLDQLLVHQWRRLLQLQSIQLDMMRELSTGRRRETGSSGML